LLYRYPPHIENITGSGTPEKRDSERSNVDDSVDGMIYPTLKGTNINIFGLS